MLEFPFDVFNKQLRNSSIKPLHSPCNLFSNTFPLIQYKAKQVGAAFFFLGVEAFKGGNVDGIWYPILGMISEDFTS